MTLQPKGTWFEPAAWMLAAALAVFGCGGEETGGGAPLDGDADEEQAGERVSIGQPFRFVVLTDAHVRLPDNPDDADYDNQKNIDNLTAAVARINAEFSDAAFAAVTGDLVGCLFSENPDDYGTGEPNPAETFVAIMDDLTLPYYTILGNHDYQKSYDPAIGEGITTDDIEAIESVWRKVLGREPYYAATHEGVKLLFLNANRGERRGDLCVMCSVEAFCTGSFDAEQLAWLDSELADGAPAILFVHHPLFTDNADERMYAFSSTFLVVEDDPFYDVLADHAGDILGVFTGHGHVWEKDTLFGTIPVFETSSIGDTNGHPDNLHVVDVDPDARTLTATIVREGGQYFHELSGGGR